MSGRARVSDAEFLRGIRGHDYSGCSDAGLRRTLGYLGSLGKSRGPDEVLPEVLALVDEAVRRRLGAWRLFAPEFHAQAFGGCREAAGRLLELGPHRDNVRYYTEDDFLDSAAFQRSLERPLRSMNLDRDDRVIVTAMVYVAEMSKLKYSSELLLAADFYRAFSKKDTGGELAFRATDEQLLAGRLLFEDKIVEMNAGEGKTLAAAFPAVLNAVLGRSVHVLTANDYLASRDAESLAPVYESLGLSVRAVVCHMSEAERRDAYKAQIVYGTIREHGFDYLRDNLRYSRDELVQRGFDVAIVDEADQVLIDEARTPLIISGGRQRSRRSVHRVRKAVEEMIARQRRVLSRLIDGLQAPSLLDKSRRKLLSKLYLGDPMNAALVRELAADRRLRRRVEATADSYASGSPETGPAGDLYYFIDARRELVTLTDRGQEFLEGHLGLFFDTSDLEERLKAIEADIGMPLAVRREESERLSRQLSRQVSQTDQVYQMLCACLLMQKDADYIVTDGAIVLVDELTGRGRPDSRYQHGLQNALEAKEGVAVRSEGEVVAQITVQGLMKQYSRVSGMTGTALASRDEFRRAYGLQAVSVPPARPSRRKDFPARLYTSHQDKLMAVLDEVKLCRRVGRPVLVGTLTVDQSEEVSRLLERHGVEHRVLNAVNNAEEAEIVRSAGAFGAVTVATNMAGRGTDIILQPDLERRVTQRFVLVVQELLRGGATQVALACASGEEAGLLGAAVVETGGLVCARRHLDGRIQVVVSRSQPTVEDAVESVLEFGLGLYVIGTIMNDASRIDLQLRGRGGRQGEFGASRFILSLEDRPLLTHAGVPVVPSEKKRDRSGRTFFEGARTERQLRSAQVDITSDDEMRRGAAWDYAQVVEHQTMSYYRLRNEVIGAESFHIRCVGLAAERARQLVDEHLPPAMIHRYPVQFERMAEELWLDYRIDCRSLKGLGVEALKGEIEGLMVARLEEVRGRVGPQELERIERLVFLRTGDDLWQQHLRRLQDQMVSTRLCGTGHKSAVAECCSQSRAAFESFGNEVIEAFLPRLFIVAFAGAGVPRAAEVGVAEDLEEILV